MQPWRRYGHDRLYVSVPDGTTHGRRLGYRDLISGADNLEPGLSPDERAAFHAALAAHVVASMQTAASPEPAVLAFEETSAAGAHATHAEMPAKAPERATTPQGERPWVDLSWNKPGQAAREQALQRRAEAPVRTTLARVLGVHTSERAWRIGADGEELVAGRLERFVTKRHGWHVLHAVPVGKRGSDIDHVVIGPGGVFTINTKNHPGTKAYVAGDTVMINGSRAPYVRNSRHEAQRAQRILSKTVGFDVPVQGVVCLAGCSDCTFKRQPTDVHVTTRRRIEGWLGQHGPVLSPAEVDTVFDWARRSTTWTS